MYGKIPLMLDCWADPVVRLLLLKSSMVSNIDCFRGNTVTIVRLENNLENNYGHISSRADSVTR